MSGDTSANSPESAPGLLLVDDEAGILAALRRVFRPHGYRIFTAGGGAEGLAVLEREAIDVVVSDMRMPEMDGAAFLEQVRRQRPRAARILLTGHADVESTVAAINRGEIWRYIAKPWNDDEIVATVKDAVARVRLADEVARLDALTRRQNDELKSLNASLEQKVAERTTQLAAALRSLEGLHAELKHNFVNSVRVFSRLVELRGGELGADFVGHGQRVADMARTVAQRLQLSDSAVQTVMLAGLLHDIGKVGLPDDLLAKPFNNLAGPLRAQVMKHPGVGENLLMAIDQLQESALAIRHHHESYDGSGYPDRLAGEQIPMAARILAVVNEYDALQLGTLAKHRHSAAEALAFIIDQRGKRYDPVVATVFAQWLLASQPGLRDRMRLPPDEAWPDLEAAAAPPVVELRPAELAPGMVLAGDLMHRRGYLLLAAGSVLRQETIARLVRIENEGGDALVLQICKNE